MPRSSGGRKRRVHTRSRNGCATCKAKHLRCDEQKPLCTRCLSTGGACGYPHDNERVPEICKEAFMPSMTEWEEKFSYSSVPCHSITGLAVDMSHDSQLLFDLFVRFRSVVKRKVSSDSHAFLVERALSSPALLHGALLLSGTRWTWFSGSMDKIRKSFMHHKLEAIKFVNERVHHPDTMTSDLTIASIASLAMAESALGSQEIAEAHLNGLAEIMATRSPRVGESDSTLLQDIVSSTTHVFNQIITRDVHHNTLAAASKNAVGFDNSEQLPATCTAIQNNEFGVKRNNTAIKKQVDERWTGKTWPNDTVLQSRHRFRACCARLWTILSGGRTDMFLLNWFIEMLIDDICSTEEAMLEGDFPRYVWLWAAMMARCAAASVHPINMLELRQIEEWKQITCGKIRLAAEVMGLRTWQAARAVIQSWAPRDLVRYEVQFRNSWEEAVQVEGSFGMADPVIKKPCHGVRIFSEDVEELVLKVEPL